MSVLLGTPDERFPLTRAVDALAEAGRRAGVPGLIWVVGAFYPSLNVSYGLILGVLGLMEKGTGIEFHVDANPGELFFLFGPHQINWEQPSGLVMIGLALLLIGPLMILYRLIVGLARVSDPGVWEEESSHRPEAPVRLAIGINRSLEDIERDGYRNPGVGAIWRAGKGLGPIACGMWVLLVLILLGATLILTAPILLIAQLFDVQSLNPLLAGVVLPILAVVLMYAIILQVVNQLALHSLAHNRRGVASALTHAWRLVRGSPWGAFRATIVDLLLFFLVLGAELLLARIGVMGLILTYCVYGFAGVTRAGYWARAYRAFGGISAADRVPGLST